MLAAAAFSGSSEGAPFAVRGSLECPPFDIGQPISEEERTYGAKYHHRVASQFIDDRVSVRGARRSELLADVLELPRFDDVAANADRVITGTVLDQRLGWAISDEDGRSVPALVSQLDGDREHVSQRVYVACEETLILLHYWWAPPLTSGGRYALVVDGVGRILLAYNLSGDRVRPLDAIQESPIPASATLDNLIGAVESN